MSHIINQSKYTRRYQPRHSLAKYIIDQIELSELRPQNIVKEMGYPTKHTIPACDRLRHVLCNRYLGLDGSYMDKYLTADEFLAKLFEVLEIPYQPFAEDIAQIKHDLVNPPKSLCTYSLRAEIDFEFVNANWMVRCGVSRLAHIRLPNDFSEMNKAKRTSIIKDAIYDHYQQYVSGLPYDGVIKSYQLIAEQNNEVIETIAYGLPKSSNV
jgi:hypothetical protein